MSDNHNTAYSNPDREQSDCFPFITLDHDHDSYAASVHGTLYEFTLMPAYTRR